MNHAGENDVGNDMPPSPSIAMEISPEKSISAVVGGEEEEEEEDAGAEMQPNLFRTQGFGSLATPHRRGRHQISSL